jgi:hypothetical protein
MSSSLRETFYQRPGAQESSHLMMEHRERHVDIQATQGSSLSYAAPHVATTSASLADQEDDTSV